MIKSLNPSSHLISFSRFQIPYTLLLAAHGWARLVKLLPSPMRTDITRGEVANCFLPAPGGAPDDEAGFIATMLWGYGVVNEGGPVKTWLGIQTPGFLNHMSNARNDLAHGIHSFGNALDEVTKIVEIGVSFGSKILYFMGLQMSIPATAFSPAPEDEEEFSAAGTSSPLPSPMPLIIDSVVCAALVAIFGESAANSHFGIKRGCPPRGKGYVAYCEALNYWAAVLGGCAADQIEMFLFTEKKNLAAAAKAKGSPLG